MSEGVDGDAEIDAIATRLLDAQVEFVLAELSGDRFAEVAAEFVADVFASAETMTVADVIDPALLKQRIPARVDTVLDGTLLEELVLMFVEESYESVADEQFTIGAVLDKKLVEQLVGKVIGLHETHERILEGLTESPLVATVASIFVNKIVTDFLAANRARAEKIPGVGSMLSMGDRAVNRVRGATDRHLGQVIGDATATAALFALRRTNSAIMELIRHAPLQEAAMELWDLYADQPMKNLRHAVSKHDQQEAVEAVVDFVKQSRNRDYLHAVIAECVDVFFENYRDRRLATLLTDLGIDRALLVEDIVDLAPPIIEAAKRDGLLAAQVRGRLAPFYRSEQVRRILAG